LLEKPLEIDTLTLSSITTIQNLTLIYEKTRTTQDDVTHLDFRRANLLSN